MHDELSIEARVAIGAWWDILLTDELRFERPWIITPETRKGLDELVTKGYLTVEGPTKRSPAIAWTPTDKMRNERPSITLKFMQQHGRRPVTDETLPKPSDSGLIAQTRRKPAKTKPRRAPSNLNAAALKAGRLRRIKGQNTLGCAKCCEPSDFVILANASIECAYCGDCKGTLPVASPTRLND